MIRLTIAGKEIKFTRQGAFVRMNPEEEVVFPKWVCRNCMANSVPNYQGGSPVALGCKEFSVVYDSPIYYLRGGKKCGVCGKLKADLRLLGFLDKQSNLFYYHSHRQLKTKKIRRAGS